MTPQERVVLECEDVDARAVSTTEGRIIPADRIDSEIGDTATIHISERGQ